MCSFCDVDEKKISKQFYIYEESKVEYMLLDFEQQQVDKKLRQEFCLLFVILTSIR